MFIPEFEFDNVDIERTPLLNGVVYQAAVHFDK